MWRSPGAEMLRTVSLLRAVETDPGDRLNERHGWRLSQHQPRPAPTMRPGPDRRDLEYQETEAESDLFAYPASLPELAEACP